MHTSERLVAAVPNTNESRSAMPRLVTQALLDRATRYREPQQELNFAMDLDEAHLAAGARQNLENRTTHCSERAVRLTL
jgi:hypothetical protein